MKLARIKFSNDATVKLRTMKSRTGITPNILCRLGFMLSLKDPTIPSSKNFPEDGMEINRYTLTGNYDSLFCALLKQRCYNDGKDIQVTPDLSSIVSLYLKDYQGHLLL